MAFVPTEEEAVPRDPAEGFAAVLALRSSPTGSRPGRSSRRRRGLVVVRDRDGARRQPPGRAQEARQAPARARRPFEARPCFNASRARRAARSCVRRRPRADGAERVEPRHVLGSPRAARRPRARSPRSACAETIANAVEADLVAMLDLVGVPPRRGLDAHAAARRPAWFSLQSKQALEQALREAVRRRDRRSAPSTCCSARCDHRGRRSRACSRVTTSSPSGWRRSCRSRSPRAGADAPKSRGREQHSLLEWAPCMGPAHHWSTARLRA